MTDPAEPLHPDLGPLGEHLRSAIIQAGIAAYEDASIQGLCAEGAWEAAIAAMRRMDLRTAWSERSAG